MKRLAIPLVILVLTAVAAGAWVYVNRDTVYGTQSTEMAAADQAAADQMAQRDLGRLAKHFKSAPAQQKKSSWGFW